MDRLQSQYSLRTLPIFDLCCDHVKTEKLRARTHKKDRFVVISQPYHSIAEKSIHGIPTFTNHVTLYPKSSLDLIYGIPVPFDVISYAKFTFHTKNSVVEMTFNRDEIRNNMIFLPTQPFPATTKSCSFEYLFCPFESGFPVAFCNKVDIEVQSVVLSLFNFRVVGAILTPEHRKTLLATKDMNLVVDTEPNTVLRSKLIYSHYKPTTSHRVTKYAINFIEPFFCHRIQEIKSEVMSNRRV